MRPVWIIVAALCCICNINLAQPKVKSMYDGEKRIYYTSLEEAEAKLLGYIQDSGLCNDFPSKYFIDLVLNDERCFYYDFTKLIEASTEVTVRPLRIRMSDDRKLRLYSWDSDGGTMSSYTGITSYKNESGIHSFASPIGDDWTSEDNDNPYIQLGNIACGVSKIITLQRNNGDNVYLVLSHSSGSNIMQSTTLAAYTISSEGLKTCEIFQTGSEYSSAISYYRDPYQAFSTGLILENNELIIPETMNSDNPYGYPRITGRNIFYKFNGERFCYDRIGYSEDLYTKLCNYQYNIVIINAEPWIIRIDKMHNGAIRYASWKNKSENQAPDLVISNGYCISSEVKDVNNASIWGPQVRKEEKYIFQNNEYFYEVSWIFEGGYEFTSLHSWKLVVKRNDKVLMTIEQDKES